MSSTQPFTIGPAPKGAGAAGAGASHLSSRATAILTTSYADSEFRQALALVDERGLGNDTETRRQLRLQLQKEAIDCHGEIINDFGKIAEQLRRIGTTLDRLNRGFDHMKSRINKTHDQAAGSIAEADSLISDKAKVETKQRVLAGFRDHFYLADDDIAALTLAMEPVDDRFFDALAKAKRITKDCEILLGFENQRLGLELMEQASKNLNLAYQKLFKWIQREFKALNLENAQISSSIRRGLRVLAGRPSLFQACLAFFADARERVLSDSFFIALTGTSRSGVEDKTVKPIDMSAHDPLRYVGDMLAWAHSATVGEREALEALFVAEGDEIAHGLRTGKQTDLWHLAADDDDEAPEFDSTQALNELIDRDMSAVGRILRQRLEQVIQSNEEIHPAYRLANLVAFYRLTFSNLLGANSELLSVMAHAESEALRQFRSLIRDHIAALQGDFQQTPGDLRPPSFLQDALRQLGSIMDTYESSFSAALDRESDFQPILAEALEPFLSGCENMARTLHPPDDSLFLINCQMSAASSLSKYDFTRARVGEIREAMDREVGKLVSFTYSFFREGSGLSEILAAIEASTATTPELFQPQALALASHTLDNFLPSALMDAIENLRHLQDSSLAREIGEEAAARFCADFARLEERLLLADELEHDGGDGDTQRLRELFPRTLGEVRVLLS